MKASEIKVGRTYVGRFGTKKRVRGMGGDDDGFDTVFHLNRLRTRLRAVPLKRFAAWAVSEMPE